MTTPTPGFTQLIRMFIFLLVIPHAALAESPLRYLDHPLAEKIWSVAEGRFINRQTLVSRMLDADIVMLGESHTNPVHHQHQLEMLEQLLARSDRPLALVMEMLDSNQQATIDQALDAAKDDINRFDALTKFSARGWEWPLYRPLIELAIGNDVPVKGANLSRERLRKVARKGESAMPRVVRRAYLKVGELEGDARDALQEAIAASHCGLIPDSMLSPLLLAQQARDVSMALAVLGVDNARPVLIAGSQHVRRDYGAARAVARLAPKKTLISIAMRPVEKDVTDLQEYLPATQPFDYIWFTGRAQPDDPCAAYQEELQHAFPKHSKE